MPVIAVFTKFDQFKRNIRMDLGANRETNIDREVEAAFDQHYLDEFTKRPPFVRLESEGFHDHLTPDLLILCSRNA